RGPRRGGRAGIEPAAALLAPCAVPQAPGRPRPDRPLPDAAARPPAVAARARPGPRRGRIVRVGAPSRPLPAALGLRAAPRPGRRLLALPRRRDVPPRRGPGRRLLGLVPVPQLPR